MIEKNEFVEEIIPTKNKRIEFKMEEELLKILDYKASLKGLNRSEYIRNLIIKDIKNINTNITDADIKRVRKLMIEQKKMRIAFNKLGVLINQSIKYKISNNSELEKVEDSILELLEKYKNEVDKYQKFLL
jgi:O-phosphoseryl-tRNA(Cys) synthetase